MEGPLLLPESRLSPPLLWVGASHPSGPSRDPAAPLGECLPLWSSSCGSKDAGWWRRQLGLSLPGQPGASHTHSPSPSWPDANKLHLRPCWAPRQGPGLPCLSATQCQQQDRRVHSQSPKTAAASLGPWTRKPGALAQLCGSGRGVAWGPKRLARRARRRLHILRITSLWAFKRFRSFSFSFSATKSFFFKASKSKRA